MNRNTGSIAVALYLIGLPATGLAMDADPNYSAAYKSCMDRSGIADPVMRACEQDELVRQEQALNAVYQRLRSLLDPGRKAVLRKSERAWLSFRDTQCDLEASGEEGGTLGRLEHAECMTKMTHQRVGALRQLVSEETF